MKIFLLVVCTLLTAVTFGQDIKWDSTFRPNNYAMKVEQFRGYANDKNDIVFLGNSITAGTDWMELLNNSRVRNRGISGDITFGILERLDEVTEGKPSKVFILIGINDISRNIPDSVILANYRKMITRIKKASPGTKIYFNTILPVNNEFTPTKNQFNKDEHVLFVNKELARICKEEKITLIDSYSHFLNAGKKLENKFTYDGLHLNPAGYKHWAILLKKYLN
jgi:lysophospholipase L1-like esterase